jgi:hypothetical protein
VEEWPLDGLRSGDTPLVLDLPTAVSLVTVRGDERALATVTHAGLRPERMTAGGLANRSATRAARYGETQVFFLDDAMYMEPAGMWTRGNATGEMVVASSGAAVQVELTAGPVPAQVEIDAAQSVQRLVMAAGERRQVTLPAGPWRVTTIGQFRPKDYDPANDDARPLGVRIEWR